MSKHSKNNNNRADFTYQERQQLTGYGTQKVRLGTNSQKKFGTCSIFLHKLQTPMCCEKGHIFCKNCGIEHLVKQKQNIQLQTEQYEAQNSEEKKQAEQQQKEIQEKQKEIDNFSKFEDTYDPNARKKIFENSMQGKANEKPLGQKELVDQYIKVQRNQSREQEVAQSFWLAENQKVVEKKAKKPDTNMKCPVSLDHNVKLKKLIPLDIKETTLENGESEYICFVCSKQLQFQKLGASKKCGHVQCLKCLQVSSKESQSCGVCMKKFDKSDLIELESSHSAFAFHNEVEAKVFQHSMAV